LENLKSEIANQKSAQRMRCERLHADISVSTCIARQRNIRRTQGYRSGA
jgi:hypothetical protein